MRRVSARVSSAAEDGAFPVILSGSCFARWCSRARAPSIRPRLVPVEDLVENELEASVRAILERFPVRAMSLTAYDPDCDPDDRVAAIAMRVPRPAAGRTG